MSESANSSFSLSGRRAVVTGASRGIGRAIAVELAAAGAEVHCVSTREGGCNETLSAIEDAGGAGAKAYACDVSDAEAVASWAKTVLEAGPVDILVNNAGVTRDNLMLRMSPEEFDSVLDVNLRGPFLVTKAFLRPLTKSAHGRLINIGSVVGLSGNAGQANYSASKAGLVGFTKSVAREFGSRGLTANVLAPGFIETDMTAELDEKVREKSLDQIPLKRFGEGREIAAAVRFLASDAGAYVTGQVLSVDGGMSS
ncbi:MAG: 3-oxoacyl-[acyl-carrier-protein] reductase [Planctomycetota bacterium]